MTRGSVDMSLYPRKWEMLLILALTALAAWPSTTLVAERLAAWAAAVTFGAYLFQRMPVEEPCLEDASECEDEADDPPDPIGDFIYDMVTGFIIVLFAQGLIIAGFVSVALYNWYGELP